MKRSSVTPGSKSKNKSLTKSASVGLVDFVSKAYPKKVNVAAITAASKVYGKGKTLTSETKALKRLAGSTNGIQTGKLIEYIKTADTQERGKALTDDGVKRVYQNFANSDGKLSFEYIMKLGEQSGVTIGQKLAKAIVRKYGKKKDHLNLDDCLRINHRGHGQSRSPSPKKEKI